MSEKSYLLRLSDDCEMRPLTEAQVIAQCHSKATGVTACRDPMRTLRKSCIDDWAKAGYPANVVKEWAGHADIKTPLTYYATVEARDVRRAVMTPMFGQSDATLDATVKNGTQANAA